MKIAQKLKELRKGSNLTQEQLAQILEMNFHVYARYEQGLRSAPIELLIKLADFYEVSLDYLCGRDEARNQQDGSDVG